MLRLLNAARLVTFLTLAGIASFPLFAEDPVTPSDAATGPELSLNECVARALKKNFDLEISGYDTQKAKENVTVAKSAFDPIGFFSSSRAYSKVATSTSALNGANRPISDTENSRLGITETVPTGGTYTLSSNLNRSFSNSSFSLINPAYSSAVTIAVNQPLLQGFGRTVSEANIETNKLSLVISNLTYKTKILTVIQSTENAYYNLVYARGQLHVRELSLDTALKVLDEAKARKNSGVATDLDIITAQVGVATARSNLVTARQAVKNSQDNLLAVIGQFELDTAIGVPHFEDFTGPTPTFDRSYKLALDNDPDFASSQAVIKQAQIALAVAKNQRLPNLSVGGNIGLGGLKDDPYRSYDQLTKDQGYTWGVNVQLSFPIGNRGPNAQLRSALSTLSQNGSRLRQLEQTVMVSVRTSIRAVEADLETVQLNATSVTLSEKTYQLEKAKYDAGLATARELQQFRDDLDTARINLLQAKVNLRNALSSLHVLEGSSLDQYHIAYTEVK